MFSYAFYHKNASDQKPYEEYKVHLTAVIVCNVSCFLWCLFLVFFIILSPFDRILLPDW